MNSLRTLVVTILLAGVPWAHAAMQDADALRAELDRADRPQADKERDAGRKPADVVAFLGFGEGMTLMDVIAAGGYYTEVLSTVVGEDGTVYSQNPPSVLQFRDGAYDKALTERLADDRLPNVVRVDKDVADLDIEPGSLDGAITALNFHDVYNSDPETAVNLLREIKDLLKPGGVLGVTDHIGNPGADNASLHRVEKQKAVDAAKQAGFEIAGDSDLLRNPDDDHTKMVFAPDVRGKTDRFLLKLVKPD